MHIIEIIILAMAIVVCIWASVFSWRMDNLSDTDIPETEDLFVDNEKANGGEL